VTTAASKTRLRRSAAKVPRRSASSRRRAAPLTRLRQDFIALQAAAIVADRDQNLAGTVQPSMRIVPVSGLPAGAVVRRFQPVVTALRTIWTADRRSVLSPAVHFVPAPTSCRSIGLRSSRQLARQPRRRRKAIDRHMRIAIARSASEVSGSLVDAGYSVRDQRRRGILG